MSEGTFIELWPHCELSSTSIRLKSYSGDCIPVVDSKEVSRVVIEYLRTAFARFRPPETITSDNGSCLLVRIFVFLLANGVKHITSAPYHFFTNGIAE